MATSLRLFGRHNAAGATGWLDTPALGAGEMRNPEKSFAAIFSAPISRWKRLERGYQGAA
jgi:hypothetical protein